MYIYVQTSFTAVGEITLSFSNEPSKDAKKIEIKAAARQNAFEKHVAVVDKTNDLQRQVVVLVCNEDMIAKDVYIVGVFQNVSTAIQKIVNAELWSTMTEEDYINVASDVVSENLTNFVRDNYRFTYV